MKITLIYPVWYSLNLEKTKFKPTSDSGEPYLDEKVCFPMNHIVRNLVSKDDDVDILLIKTESASRNTDSNVIQAKEEITNILNGYCRSLNFKTINAPYASSPKELGQIYLDTCGMIAPESRIHADLTFGAKYMPLILFCVLNYAEKYLDCDVSHILYGLFDNHRGNEGTMVDFTGLYLLNTFGAIFDGSKENFDDFAHNLLK